MKKLYIITFLLLLAFAVGCSKNEIPTGAAVENIIGMPANQGDVPEMIVQEGQKAYYLDISKSTLKYTASKIVGNLHTGTVALSKGNLITTDDLPKGNLISGEFTIDMTTFTESKNNERFLKHIASADFFDVEKYPTSKITLKKLEKTGDNYQVTGDLTIKDTTKEITFPATAEFTDDEFRVKAKFQIDRTKWDLTYGSGSFFKEMGDKAIKDLIDYELNLVFN